MSMLFGYRRVRQADRAGRAMLYIAGCFNFSAAAIVMLIVRFAPDLIGLVQPVSGQMLFIDLVIGLIVIFGIGYMLAAHDLSRFWPCVALGIAGKSLFVVLIFSYFALGLIGTVLAVLVCGDLVFTVLFHRLLERHAQTEEFPHV